jgi:transcriptional regulator with XRE-family HTH domain
MKRYQVLIQQRSDESGAIPLANSLGVSLRLMRNYMEGKTEPKISVMQKMSEVFGEPFSALVVDDGKPYARTDKNAISPQLLQFSIGVRRYHLLIERQAHKIGLRNFAREVGIPAQSLSNYLADAVEPRAANLEKLSRYFGESVGALLTEVGGGGALDNEILEELKRMPKRKKEALLTYMKGMK